MIRLKATARILRTIVLGATLVNGAQCDESLSTLIDGVVSRATAIHSAQIQYQYASHQSRHGDSDLQQQVDLHISVQGLDWVLRYADSSNFRMKRNNSTANYYEATSAETQSTHRSLHIEGAETLEELIAQHASHAAPRLGTLWFSQQVDFVNNHRKEARLMGSRDVNGTETVQIEWTVRGRDFDEAMIVIPNAIARARRGRLRLCVAPTLGFVLPLIEYLDPDGDVATSFSASEFKVTEGGLYFPHQAACTTRIDDGDDVSTYKVSRVSNVNAPLPDSVFAVKIPQGTRVRDSRPGVPVSIFYLKNQSQFDELNRALEPRVMERRWSIRRALLIVNALVFVTFVSGYVIRKCVRSSSA